MTKLKILIFIMTFTAIFTAIFTSALARAANAADIKAIKPVLVLPQGESEMIKNLKWDFNPIVLKRTSGESKSDELKSSEPKSKSEGASSESADFPETLITVSGTYLSPDNALIDPNGKSIAQDSKGHFEFDLKLNSPVSLFKITAIDSLGTIERETLTVIYHPPIVQVSKPELTEKPSEKPSDGDAVAESKKNETESQIRNPKKRYSIVPGLGVSSISQTQTATTDYSTIALTAKVSANYLLIPPKWDIGFSGYATVLQLSQSRTVDVQYIGLNFKAGYIFPQTESKFSLSLYFGSYYVAMTSTPHGYDSNKKALKAIGYDKVSGPEVYPVLRYTFSERNSLSSYLKYAPISSGYGFLGLSNREIAAGLGYSHVLKNSHSLGGTFDYSNILIQIGKITHGTQSMTLGISYSL